MVSPNYESKISFYNLLSVDKRVRRVIWSTLTTVGLAGLGFIVSVMSAGDESWNFGLAIFFIVTLFIAAPAGALVLTIRKFGGFRDTSHFLYIFIGTLSSTIGLIGLILISTHRAEKLIVLLSALCTLFGLTILLDTFTRK